MTLFTPRLLNGPFGDAALLLESDRHAEKILFDLGDLHRLDLRDLAKISLIFVTHTHMDHFSGFEQLLRQNLSRTTPLQLFGPKNFIRQVAAKLQGFTWNLITDSCYTLEITVHEVTARQIASQRFTSQQAFKPSANPTKRSFNGLLYKSDAFQIEGALLDHGTPVLGLSFTEAPRFNIKPEGLATMGLAGGPWLQELKNALMQTAPGTKPFTLPLNNGQTDTYTLDQLKATLIYETPPYKLAYITDLTYSPANIRKVCKLAHQADRLYLEATFIDADHETALAKKHLTASQSGELARLCKAKHLNIFHFSERYQHREAELHQEARQAFESIVN